MESFEDKISLMIPAYLRGELPEPMCNSRFSSDKSN